MMKRAIIFMVFSLAAISTFAQIQRKVADIYKIRGIEKNIDSNLNASTSKKKDQLKLMKELGLNREQKGKLKEMRQLNQAKRAAIINDYSLTAAQKQAQLKAIKLSGAVGRQGILSEAQKQKMNETRKERNEGNGEELMIKE